MMIGSDGKQIKKTTGNGDLLLLAKISSKLLKLMTDSLSVKKLKMKRVSRLSSFSIVIRMSGNLNSLKITAPLLSES